MKDIPVFTTEYGTASLILREIPYRQEAYVQIQATQQPRLLVQECTSFCRACGAERVYAAGHPNLEEYPFHTAIWHMRCERSGLPDTDAALWPVQAETLEQWRQIYNERMARVANAASMCRTDGTELLRMGDAYFVHRGETLLGIGRATGEKIDAVVSCQRGAGRDVVLALAHALSGEQIVLEVASANERAIRLYRGLGFVLTEEISRWYQIF